MGDLLQNRDIVLNEMRVRLHHAARAKDISEIERYALLIEQIVDELGESKEGRSDG